MARILKKCSLLFLMLIIVLIGLWIRSRHKDTQRTIVIEQRGSVMHSTDLNSNQTTSNTSLIPPTHFGILSRATTAIPTTYISTQPNTKICSPSERALFLRDQCHGMSAKNALKTHWQQPSFGDHVTKPEGMPKPRFYINHDKQMIYCQISKVACTTWTGLITAANLNHTFASPMRTHGPKRLAEAKVTLEQNEISRQYENYTKFAVVRHPFDRIVSSFYNIVNREKYPLGPEQILSETLKKRFHITKINQLTFVQFIDFLTDDTHKTNAQVFFDRHLNTFAHACNFCDVTYDCVIRYEDMSRDASPVLQKLGFDADFLLKMAVSNKGKRDQRNLKNGVMYLKELADIDSEKLSRLMKRYSVDMQLLGYDFDVDKSLTSCGLNIDGEEECC